MVCGSELVVETGEGGKCHVLGLCQMALNSSQSLFLSLKSEIVIPYVKVVLLRNDVKVLENLLSSPCNFLILSRIF